MTVRSCLQLMLVGVWALPLEGCASSAHFDDMRKKIDELEIPVSYQQGGEHKRGGRPVLFGDLPAVTRGYRSPSDLKSTCAELEEALTAREPEWIYLENKCIANFRMTPGFRAMTAVSYSASVTAIRPRDGKGTAVLVTISE